MSECVILYRNPQNNAIGCITQDDGDSIATFPSYSAAMALSREHILLKAWPFQIVEIDEL